MSAEGHLNLYDFIFIGRTYDEYLRMFGLQDEDIAGKRILDCPGGACSFTGRASLLGTDVVAADMLYELGEEVLADLEKTRQGMIGAKDAYVWDEFGNLNGLIQTQKTALADLIKDYHEHRYRYVAATLPHLPCFSYLIMSKS